MPGSGPLVEAVVVAESPGDWFDEVLTALVAQDYGRMRITVIDAPAESGVLGDTAGLRERVLAVAPRASVVPAPEADHYAEAANQSLDVADRSQFVLLCQDHVALAPDAVRTMVEEAVRSNAGIVGPKLVEWTDPRRIAQVGMAVDKLGVPAPYAEAGEFDQEQHDAVRDVFAIPAEAMLVRSDLFKALGGFDDKMKHRGFALDFCWRAHAVGARVMIAPKAVGRVGTDAAVRVHGEEAMEGFASRASLRSMLSNYSLGHLFRVLPQWILVSVLSSLAALFGGRFMEVGRPIGVGLHNLMNVGSIIGRRSSLRGLRATSDAEVRRFQVRGFEALNQRVRQRGERSETDPGRFNRVTNQARTREIQARLGVWIVTVATVVFGSRRMIQGDVPVINEFGAFGAGPQEMIQEWFSSHRTGGLGSEGFAPTVDLLVGALGFVALGQMGLLRTLLTVGMIVLGAGGMYRFMAPFRSLIAQVAAPLIYVALPLSYNALANGSWQALVLLGGLPWVLKWLVSAAGMAPFARPDDVWVWARRTLVVAVWIALIAAWAPVVAGAVAVVVLGLVLGGIFTGRPGPSLRLIVTGVLGVVGAFVLHLPWSTELLVGEDRWSYFADGRALRYGVLSIYDLLRLQTGPHGGIPFGWALIALAALSLLMSRRGRLVWAVRGWMIAILSWGIAWVEQQNEIGFALPAPEVLLTPAAMGIAVAASMAVLAFERDLRDYGFGWRQAMPLVALVALFAAFVGGAGGTFDGRWDSPRNGFEIATLFLADGEEDAARVLWIGEADVLPVGATPFTDDLALGLTPARTPDVRDLFPARLGDGGEDLHRALDVGLRGGSSRLGSLLAPFGIRHVILVERIAPPYDAGVAEVSPRVLNVFTEQLDLEETQVRVGMRVFRNTAWVPTTSAFPEGQLLSPGSPASIFDGSSWRAATARFALAAERSGTSYSGALTTNTELFHSVNASENWTLTVDDTTLVRSRAFDWANAWIIPEGGPATLSHATPSPHRLALGGQLLLWGVVAVIILAGRRRT